MQTLSLHISGLSVLLQRTLIQQHFFENGVSESDSRRQAYKSIIKDWEVNLESEKSSVSGAQCAMEAAVNLVVVAKMSSPQRPRDSPVFMM